MTARQGESNVSAVLARDRLGVLAVMSFVMSGIAPLTVTAGIITTAFAVTGLIAIPVAFVVTALIFGLFSVGYVAMARQVTNAGAFYAFIARGLGRPLGVSAALVALVSYNMLQVGLYGAFGPAMHQYILDKTGLSAPWWAWSLGAWLVVAILGLAKPDLNSKILVFLLSAEVLVVIGLSINGIRHPANGLSVATLDPTKLVASGAGALLIIAAVGYIGFESAAIFSEEARDHRRTVATATFLSLFSIMAVYALASWAMAVHYGDGAVVAVAQQQGPGMLFAMGGQFLSEAGNLFYLTSLFAAMVAFHSFVSRYQFALGRERVLPAWLGRTSNNVPKAASIVQSVIGFAVITTYAAMGWDPLVRLFFWFATTGGYGILALITVTSMAVIGFFIRHAFEESLWQRMIAPGLATIVLVIGFYLSTTNYSILLGVPPGSTVATVLPFVILSTAIVGFGIGLGIRLYNRPVYNNIGLGGEATTYQARTDFAPGFVG